MKKGGDPMPKRGIALEDNDSQVTEAEEIKHSAEYKKIRSDLINQLKKTGADTAVFVNLVDVYMGYYITVTLCDREIERHGILVPYNNGGNQSGVTDNPACDKKVKASTQMLKILQSLNIKVIETKAGETEVDEL